MPTTSLAPEKSGGKIKTIHKTEGQKIVLLFKKTQTDSKNIERFRNMFVEIIAMHIYRKYQDLIEGKSNQQQEKQ